MDVRRASILTLCITLTGCGNGSDSKDGEDVIVIDEPDSGAADTAGAMPDQQTAEDIPSPSLEPACGDGTLDPDEACDDGNTEDRDGCSDVCEIETVVLRNLEATLSEGDDLGSCGEGTMFPCEAFYGISLTIANYTESAIARISNIRVTFDGVELSTGGLSCDAERWLVPADTTSSIIDLGFSFHGNRYALYWFCTDQDGQVNFADVYVDQRAYAESGQVEFMIRGLLEDGAVWETSATTMLKDLR